MDIGVAAFSYTVVNRGPYVLKTVISTIVLKKWATSKTIHPAVSQHDFEHGWMVITSIHALSVGVKAWAANTVISAPFENKALFFSLCLIHLIKDWEPEMLLFNVTWNRLGHCYCARLMIMTWQHSDYTASKAITLFYVECQNYRLINGSL